MVVRSSRAKERSTIRRGAARRTGRPGPIHVRAVRTGTAVAAAQRAIRAYGRSLNVDLSFQRFEEEVKDLPGEYVPPNGDLWLAWAAVRPVGVVAFRSLGGHRAELKRLYVYPRARGGGLGRRLTQVAIRAARRRGFRWIYLDTLESMSSAIQLYEDLGFLPTKAYRFNPILGSRFFRLRLT